VLHGFESSAASAPAEGTVGPTKIIAVVIATAARTSFVIGVLPHEVRRST
jgi:hypothetical protein